MTNLTSEQRVGSESGETCPQLPRGVSEIAVTPHILFFFNHQLPHSLSGSQITIQMLILREKKTNLLQSGQLSFFSRAHSAEEMFLSWCVTPAGLGSRTELPSLLHWVRWLGGQDGIPPAGTLAIPTPGLVKVLVHLL